MIKGKINLAAFKHAVMDIKKKDGSTTKAIVIPVEDNSLFLSEKGNVYFDFYANEIPLEKRRGDHSHLINQSLPKEKREALKAESKYAPTLGSLTVGSFDPAPTAVSDFEAIPEKDMPF